MSSVSKYDHYLQYDGPAALVIHEHLQPVEGPDGVVFPATYAGSGNNPSGYNIDKLDDNGKNICLIDSVGSQANRIEPMFMDEKYQHLIPQITVGAGESVVNLLEAGHRAGDALLRCTSIADEIEKSFVSILKGDASPLADYAPTSIVFGAWNSRGATGSQAKLPRLISSVVRAYDVKTLTRSATYISPVNYAALDVFSEEEKEKAEGNNKNPLSVRGFVNALATATHGGVIATGGIRRDATLLLAALRNLRVGTDKKRTLELQRYILGISLTAFTANSGGYLRQGCLLVQNPAEPKQLLEVLSSGERLPCKITHEECLAYATAAAKEYGVGGNQTLKFDKKLAKQDVAKKEKPKPSPKRGKNNDDSQEEGEE